jgi:BMFP domain-containing protein YqiC
MSDNSTVRIYNKSRRSFLHGEHKAPANAFSEVPRKIADLWIEQFPNDVVLASDAQKEINGMATELEAARAELKTARTTISTLEARIAELESSPKKAGRKQVVSDAI